ncbi:5'-nucleotidase C-terminal domain-containing protein [Tissierella praeacuta]|uniref:5'-nucleotidase C-terminal domain-containing protein n=1 Tax=Tissierella praeacuta TaxID=43131 RepID=UPI0028A823EB|nr:5'-nucleotidase C-terminal domain-containing protein [Tissierella praeacuta]
MNFRNKRVVSLFLAFVLLLGIMIGALPVFAEEAKILTIVHVNDVHGRLNLDEREGGIGLARLKTKVDELKAKNPNLLLLNAGDTLHGAIDINITKGETMINLMNKIGFDAMVPGNHDFNYGYKRLLELKDKAEFPMIGSNIVKEANGKSDFEPYKIFDVDGIKVGIFGLGTEETKYKSHPSNTEGIKFEDPVEVAKKMVKELKEKEVNVIIALAHLGVDESTDANTYDVAKNVEGIDLIVDGHSHTELPNGEVKGDTLIVQAGSYLKNIGIVELEVSEGKVNKKTAKLFGYDEGKDLVPNPIIEEEIKKIEEINKSFKEAVVGKSKVNLVGEREVVRKGESNLGNLLTDAMIKATGADVALTNGGGIRASIVSGDIKVGDILTSFPFTNTLAVIEVTGEEIVKALEHGVDMYPEAAGHFPHIGGITFKFDPSKPVGSRTLDINIKGEPVKSDKKYKLVTNDFVASGGDGYTMFKGKPFIAEGGLLSDILIEYFKEVGEVEPKVEGRVVVVESPKPTPAPTPVKPVPQPEIKPESKPEVKPQPEVKPGAAITIEVQKYVVKPGDVLWKIAKQFNTTWEKLAEYNKLKNPHLIFPNQVILIP